MKNQVQWQVMLSEIIEVLCVKKHFLQIFHPHSQNIASYKEEDLKEWIMSLGFGPQIVNVNLDSNIIEEFKDGYFPCNY